MAGTKESFKYEDLMRIWKVNQYDKSFIIKPSLPYSKGCVVISLETGKIIREFEKNYDLFEALLEGWKPSNVWVEKGMGLFDEQEVERTGYSPEIPVNMAIDYTQVLSLLLPSMIGEEIPKEWLDKLYKVRLKIR